MRDFFALAATVLLFGAVAGCGDRSAATAAGTSDPATTASPPPDVSSASVDEHVMQRYGCQADTGVELLDDGTARVSLPGGERHTLTRVAGSDPQVYTGDSLYFTIQGSTAHLSQQDGARELACAGADKAGQESGVS